ncbi:MAG: imidazole glycerol phosphate synthase subunit HisH [Elusimicrobia bacterium]|nr:imidazole glycerol phosphate synthase subunit HisH [Elusimicrobiota bacterium]
MIVVVDYGMGNLRSVAKAFEAMAAEVLVSADPADLARAERIVLPGVGAFCDGIRNVERAGWPEALRREVLEGGKPFLGICLGMQMLAEEGREHGTAAGLGWVKGTVDALRAPGLKIPHMGWNAVSLSQKEHPLFAGLGASPIFYFAHSFVLHGAEPAAVAATCDYGGPFTAAVAAGNVAAVQFHPEKSQDAGLRLLRNFMSWTPERRPSLRTA